jgi:hypothetical protein
MQKSQLAAQHSQPSLQLSVFLSCFHGAIKQGDDNYTHEGFFALNVLLTVTFTERLLS